MAWVRFPDGTRRKVERQDRDDAQRDLDVLLDLAEGTWLPVVGPACFVIWRRLAQALLDQPGGLVVTAGALARSVGMATATGDQSGLARSLRRLSRFGVAWLPRDDLVVVRCQLPVLDDTRMERLRPLVEQLRRELRSRLPPA
jgi:hypothetical protein